MTQWVSEAITQVHVTRRFVQIHEISCSFRFEIRLCWRTGAGFQINHTYDTACCMLVTRSSASRHDLTSWINSVFYSNLDLMYWIFFGINPKQIFSKSETNHKHTLTCSTASGMEPMSLRILLTKHRCASNMFQICFWSIHGRIAKHGHFFACSKVCQNSGTAQTHVNKYNSTGVLIRLSATSSSG